MRKFICPNSTQTTEMNLTSFLSLVTAWIKGYKFPWIGLHSRDSVMTVAFRKMENGDYEVGLILQERPLHWKGLLAEFPAGKIEDDQTPLEAARMESKQEGGLILGNPIQFGQANMQFLHLIDEKVYLFVAPVVKTASQQLQDGETVKGIKLVWIPWKDLCNRIKDQEFKKIPLFQNAPMDGVSLTSLFKLMALGFNPQKEFG